MGDGHLSVRTGKEAARPVRADAPDADRAQYERCFACGPNNPAGLRLEFQAAGDGGDHVFADWVPDPAVHQGWPHSVHGGLVSTLLDEAAAYVAYVRGQRAATARLTVRFHGPAAVDDALRVDARLTRATRRLLEVRSWVTDLTTGDTVAEADASLMVITDAQRREFGLEAAPTAAGATRRKSEERRQESTRP